MRISIKDLQEKNACAEAVVLYHNYQLDNVDWDGQKISTKNKVYYDYLV